MSVRRGVLGFQCPDCAVFTGKAMPLPENRGGGPGSGMAEGFAVF
ncbi:MAG: hypothetical protein ACLFUY_11170 [Desulfobacterales bacterium]